MTDDEPKPAPIRLTQEEIMARETAKKFSKRYEPHPNWDWEYERPKGVLSSYSVSKKLREVGKSSEEFEIMVANLTLEDLIALKLELSSKLSNRIFPFRILKTLPLIVKEAVIRYTVAMCDTRMEASRWLGVSDVIFMKIFQKHFRAESFFYPRKANLDEQPDQRNDYHLRDLKKLQKAKETFLVSENKRKELEEQKKNS
jgi:hypothetical protein